MARQVFLRRADGGKLSSTLPIMQIPTKTSWVRFGAFEADLRTCELRKHGLRIKLQDQPFQVLALLLQRPGEMVSREELRQNLWPEDTFVDFDVGLNNAIKRLRDALADKAEHPRYVETLPRRGYRFIAPIENGMASREAGVAVALAAVDDVERPPVPAPKLATELAVPSAAQPIPRWLWITVPSVVVLLAVVIAVNLGGWRNGLPPTARAGSIQSIAVLPLKNLTGDPAQEYFVDGMTEALITELAQINTLTVISETSVMHYKESHKSLPEIAKELNVEGVVEGAVVRSGGRVRIDAQLIYAPTDRHFWAKSYERNMTDILLLQSEVAQSVASEIRAKLTPPERARLARARQVNPEAYEAYLKGRFFWNRRVEVGVRKGMAFFQQAIQLDPAYAPAYSGLADSYTLLGFGAAGGMSAAEAEPKAKAAAEKALVLDGTLAEAHASLAFIKSRSGSDLTGAEKEFQRAIELNPGYANAYFWYSQLLEGRGRRQEALEKAQRAVQLDPASPFIQRWLGDTLIRHRDYDRAIEHLRLATELAPDLDIAHLDLGYAYLSKGMFKEAIAEEQKALELSPEEPSIKAVLAHAYALSGRRGEAERLLAELKVHASDPDIDFFIGGVCVALGRKDEGLAWLERAFQGHSDWMDWVPYDWGLDPLRSDPRFQELLERFGVSADVPGSH